MKINHLRLLKVGSWAKISLASVGILIVTACSTGGKGIDDADYSTEGPQVLSARAEPGIYELDRELQPTMEPKIIANIESGATKQTPENIQNPSGIDEVKIRFRETPIVIHMTHVGGTTWRASLTPEQLQILAVSGKTVTYSAEVIARTQIQTAHDGHTLSGTRPVAITVKTPDLSNDSG